MMYYDNYILMNQTGYPEEMALTTIKISQDLRDELRELGKKGESYEDVIKRLIQVYKNHQGN